MTNSKYTAKSETERVFSVFETFKKDSEKTKALSGEDPKTESQPVLTMSCIGQLGRFVTQLFQYAFLRICAEKSGGRGECSPWIGQTLFGHNDTPISKRLPPAIELKDMGDSLFEVIPQFIPYLEKLADAKSLRIGADSLNSGLVNVDIWGFFQIHTRYFKPHQQDFRSLFKPVNDLNSSLDNGLNILRSQGKTIIGLHIRQGDYIKEPRLGFTLVFPTQWYCECLERIWDNLEDPVLFLCSNDLDSILGDFEKFSPVTSRDLDIKLPENMKDEDLDFYIDFFILSNCDIVVTSNSTFSFVACMLNEKAKMFLRPCWDFSLKFVEFDPWDSEPILYIGGDQPKFFKSLPDIVYITYMTQGIWQLLKSIFLYLPKSGIKGLALQVYLGYQVKGFVGIFQSLLYILGRFLNYELPFKRY